MSYRSEITKKNLFSLSQEKLDFQTALKEWEHTGLVVDHSSANESCQLCDHHNLRYHFEIKNHVTNNSLQVGSSCIEKFNITVYDNDGNKLHGQGKSKQLKDEIRVKQQEMMLEPIRQLWKTNKNHRDKIKRYVEEFKRREDFSPRNLLYLFQQMNDNEIVYSPRMYKVALRSNQDKDNLFGMLEVDKNLIWDSLTTPQKQRYAKGKEKFDVHQKEIKLCKQNQEVAMKYQQNQVMENYRELNNIPAPSFRSPESLENYQGVSLPEQPIRYDEKAHRLKVTFFDQNNKSFKRFFRGNLEESRRFIEQIIENDPKCSKVEIRITSTNELMDIFQKNAVDAKKFLK